MPAIPTQPLDEEPGDDGDDDDAYTTREPVVVGPFSVARGLKFHLAEYLPCHQYMDPIILVTRLNKVLYDRADEAADIERELWEIAEPIWKANPELRHKLGYGDAYEQWCDSVIVRIGRALHLNYTEPAAVDTHFAAYHQLVADAREGILPY